MASMVDRGGRGQPSKRGGGFDRLRKGSRTQVIISICPERERAPLRSMRRFYAATELPSQGNSAAGDRQTGNSQRTEGLWKGAAARRIFLLCSSLVALWVRGVRVVRSEG